MRTTSSLNLFCIFSIVIISLPHYTDAKTFYVAKDIKIINNTFAFPNQFRKGHIISYGTNVLVQNNIFYKPLEDAFSRAEGITSRNNIIDLKVDKGLMKDPDHLDFHLIPGSPAIDAGAPDCYPVCDHDDNSRPLNRGFDIGTFESIMVR